MIESKDDYGLHDSDTSGRRRRLLVRGSGSTGLLLSGETLENTKEAIEAHLMALKEDQVLAPVKESIFIGKVRMEVAD